MKLITNTGEVLDARRVDGQYLNVDLGSGRGECKALRGDFIVEMPGGEKSIVTLSTVERLGWEVVEDAPVEENLDPLPSTVDTTSTSQDPANGWESLESQFADMLPEGAVGRNANGQPIDEFGQVVA